MKARIELLGSSIDVLDILTVLGSTTGIIMEKDGEMDYFASDIEKEEEIAELRDNLKDELIMLNGIAKFLYGNHKSVSLGNAQVIQDDGSISAYIYPMPIEVRFRGNGTLTDSSGQSKSEKSLSEIAATDQTLKDVFIMIEVEGYTWVNMYRIYESIKEKDTDSDEISDDELKLFTHTANNKKAIGFQARQGHSKFVPPKIPMTQKDARSLINKRP